MSNLNPDIVGEEIARQGIYTGDGFLSEPVYKLVTEAMPIVCVDVIPVDISKSGIMRIGIITRATGSEAGKPAILGGRVQKNETISGAIHRHLYDSFENGHYEFHDENDEDTPFHLAQYKHAHSSDGPFDPTKQAITPTYLIDIPEPLVVRREASSFDWVGLNEIPTESAYNHHLAMQKAADFLRRIHPDFK